MILFNGYSSLRVVDLGLVNVSSGPCKVSVLGVCIREEGVGLGCQFSRLV